MNTVNAGWRADLRMMWAITAKDIVEALKNKNIVSVIAVSLLIVVFYRLEPALAQGSRPPNVLVYDENRSALAARLNESRAFRVSTSFQSEAELKAGLADRDLPALGLVIPGGFDGAAAAGGAPALRGYVMYWVKDADAEALRRGLEAEIARLVGSPVTVDLQEPVYNRLDSEGIGVAMALSIVFLVVMVGLTLVAHLMLEEKKNRTIEALLVSPAGAGHLVAAKALTGMFYTLLGGAVALGLNRDLMVHWPLAVAALVLGALFFVALGLWLGARIEDRGQLAIWSWILVLPLVIPMFLVLLRPLVPAAVGQALSWIPTVALFNLLRAAVADPISLGDALPGLAWVAVWAAAALVVVAWQVRRQGESGSLVPARARSAPSVASRPAAALRGAEALPAATLQAKVRLPAAEQPGKEDSGSGLAGKAGVEHVLPANLRIVWAIAAKDIREAVRNRLFLSILLGAGLLIAANGALSLLLSRDSTPTAVVYDQGGSATLRELARRPELRLILVSSRADMEKAVTEAPGLRLGLVVPANLDAPAPVEQAVELAGYMAHWAARDTINRWAVFYGERISTAIGRPVRVNLGTGPDQAEHLLYPGAGAGGEPLMTAILLVSVIGTLGLALVPLLLVEEKEEHTLETLLISPASLGQLVTAKAMTGFVYCLAAAAVLFAFKWQLFVSPPAALMAVLLGTGCVVALGLLLGTLSNNPSTVGVWGVVALLTVAALTGAAFLVPATWPLALRSFLAWLPGAVTVNLLRYSMTQSVPAGLVWGSVAALAGATAAVYVLAGVLLRRANG